MHFINSFYKNLKIKYKLIIIFSFIVILSLAFFFTVSLSRTERIIVENENRIIRENLNKTKINLKNYLSFAELSFSSIIYSNDVQDAFNQDLDVLDSVERLEYYNRIQRRLFDMFNNSYGIHSLSLVSQYDAKFNLHSTYDALGKPDILKLQETTQNRGGSPVWSIIEDSRGRQHIVMYRAIRDLRNLYDPSNIGYGSIVFKHGIFNSNFYSDDISGIFGVIDEFGTIFTSDIIDDKDWIDITDINDHDEFFEKSFDGADYLFFVTRDDFTGWIIFYAIDKNVLLHGVEEIRRTSLIVLGITLILVIGISILIASSVTKPINQMVSGLREVDRGNLSASLSDKRGDEIGILSQSFNNMIDKIRRSIPLKREKLFRSLLMDTLTAEQYEAVKKDKDIIFCTKNTYQVVILKSRTDISDEFNRQIEHIIAEFEEEQQDFISSTLRNGEYCIISNNYEDETQITINKLLIKIRKIYGIELTAFSGRNYENYHFIRYSYEEAQELVRFRVYRTSNYHYIDKSMTHSDTWDSVYPEFLETKLLHAVRQGELQDCQNILDEVLIFFKDKNSSPSVVHAFTLSVYLRLYRITSKLNSSSNEFFGTDFLSPENMLILSEPVEVTLKLLYRVIESVVLLITSGKDHNISSNIHEALKIIHNEYYDPNLGVDTIAERIHLNENYLSRLFKKEIGISIVEYKSRLRLEQAKKLLSENIKNINDISNDTGFYNSNYFRTWFKENTGLTPSQYREQVLSSQ